MKISSTVAVIILTPGFVMAGGIAIPNNILESLEKATKTGDIFIIEAVKTAAIAKYPSLKSQVNEYISPEKKVIEIAKPLKIKEKSPFKGQIEAGFDFASGNTDRQNMNLAAKVEYDVGEWGNRLKFRLNNSQENDIQVSEDYRIQGQTRYKLSSKDYVFGEVEYVNDRFSGFNHRFSELIGYGRTLLKYENFNLDGEVSSGARQSVLSNDKNENSFIQKFSGKLDWQITEAISFTEELSTSIGSDSIITESDTSLKSHLVDDLYLKLGLNIEHLSKTTADKDNIDILTTLNLVYDF